MSTPYTITDEVTYSELNGGVSPISNVVYGEVNTAENVGASGIGVYDAKSGSVLQFRNIAAASPRLAVALDAPNRIIQLDANLAVNDLSDVNIPSPSVGQAIVWDGSQWIADTAGDPSPLTTKGDIYTYTTDNARLPLGTNGQWLKVNTSTPTGLQWAALDAADIQSGVFSTALIPNLDAGKITSGIIDIARIPTIPAANVSAGTFPAGAFTFTTSVTSPRLIATDTSTATEGSNVAVNGTFDVGTGWTLGTGWSIGAGVATKTAGTQSDLSQSVGQAANQMVRVRFDYTRTAGTLSVILGGTTYATTYSSASGSVDIYITAANTGVLSFRGDASFAGTIDNVVVNRITARTQAVDIPTVGTRNLGLGSGALENVISGTDNFAFGNNALLSLISAVGNVAIGASALRVSNANNNIAIGTSALSLVINGGANIAIGTGAGQKTTTSDNTIIGVNAGTENTTGSSLVIVGREASRLNVSGAANTVLGSQAGRNGTSYANVVFIGYRAGRDETNSNRLYIANSETSTPLIFGIFSGTGAGLTIHSQNVAGVPLIVKGIASQSSDLHQWQDSTGAVLARVTAVGNAQFVEVEIDGNLNHDGSGVGFYGTAPVAKPTVSGSRGGNAALESLLTALASQGLITNSTAA